MRVMGIDEVGRGCWAGPLVAGAVILPLGFQVPLPGAPWKLTDSKQMTAHQRQIADREIRAVALAVGLGWVSNDELDTCGLSAAVALAMRRAVQACNFTPDQIIIDGAIQYLPEYPQARAIVKADLNIPAVSAASIVAKVARDQWMAEAAKRFPGYGFERHVGYGTASHRQALRQLGVCQLHRRSFRPVAALC